MHGRVPGSPSGQKVCRGTGHALQSCAGRVQQVDLGHEPAQPTVPELGSAKLR